MHGTVADWRRVAGNVALIQRAARAEGQGVSGVAALRRDFTATDVAIALELARAREKAATKFGDVAAGLIADLAGVQQASGQAVARHKAEHFRACLGGGAAIADLCCGVGGDTLALCQAELSVTAVDRDPVRAWMARHNSGSRASAVCTEVANWPGVIDGRAAAIHIDPARRNEATGKRTWSLDQLQPPPEQIGRLIGCAAQIGAAVKLSPGVDLDALPWPGEVEFIAEGNRLVQAVLWTGQLQRAERRATLITPAASHLPESREEIHTLEGIPGTARVGPPARYLYAVHPAVERAQLIHLLAQRHNAPLVHPKLGLLSCETPITSPWLTGFELLTQLPWRLRKVKQWLADHDGGIVEVKTRGKAVEPDTVSKQLRGKGNTPYTLFILRRETRVGAWVCRRMP